MLLLNIYNNKVNNYKNDFVYIYHSLFHQSINNNKNIGEKYTLISNQ